MDLGRPRGRHPRAGGLSADADARGADAELVERVLAGDQRAFTELVRRYDHRLRGVAYKLLGDQQRMEDAMQEAYLRAYRSLHRFRRDAELGSWLYRIVYNASIDELRRSGRQPTPIDTDDPGWDAPSPQPGPERVVHAADSTMRALAGLPEDQRITVLLVDGEGMDNVEAAEVLGVPRGTIASRLSRGRATMRRALAEDER